MAEPCRILVVQAEDAERLFQRALFAEAGMSVIEACSGAEALDFLATDRPDLVVLGRTLPDLDGLKPINDQFGHVVGDKVLRAVGNSISKCVRVSDIAARYGGDEFAVILPQTPPEGAMRVVERMLRTISELSLQDEEGNTCKVTASLGLAYYPADDVESAEDLVHSADGALYGAKRSGKNRFSSVRPIQPLATA